MADRKEKRFRDVPINTVPEVLLFEQAKARLADFRRINPDFFKHLDQLEADYNQALEAADKACRARKVSCGSFHLYQEAYKPQPELLAKLVGDERFVELGGTIAEVKQYKIDKESINAAKLQNAIDESTYEQVLRLEVRYHKPDKVVIP